MHFHHIIQNALQKPAANCSDVSISFKYKVLPIKSDVDHLITHQY